VVPTLALVGLVTVGVVAEVAVTCAEPLTYAARVVVMVAVDEVLAATPLTVTKPVPDIATVPLAVAVPP
jgi:hypothetical protein